MKNVFKIVASAGMKNRFRDLLEEDFVEPTLHECLALFRQLLNSSGHTIVFEWEEKPVRGRKQPYPIPAAATDYLRDYLEQANDGAATALPEHVPDRTSLERQTWVAGVCLTFQSRVRLEGDGGFARDVQSLLYQLCLHVLSPKLVARGLADANAFLLNALFAHAKSVWTDRPEHQTYLLATLYEHTGQHEEALSQLEASIRYASRTDHDFITKAQSYWSMLIELGRISEAFRFVLRLHRTAAEKDLPELEELVMETSEILSKAS